MVEHEIARRSTKPSFQDELSTLINKYSLETGSDTPDFILARYLMEGLRVFNDALADRDKWYRGEASEGDKRDNPL